MQGGARLAAGLLEKLGVGRAVIVGHSAGGLTALELHRRRVLILAAMLAAVCHCLCCAFSSGQGLHENLCCRCGGCLDACMQRTAENDML